MTIEITVLKIACMYCGADMGEKDGEGVTGVSHSICEECWYEHCGMAGQYPGWQKGMKRRWSG